MRTFAKNILLRIFGYDISFKRTPATENRTAAGFTGQNYLIEHARMSPVTNTRATDKNILGLSPVWSAIRYISEGVAMLPLDVYRRTPEGNIKTPNHPLQYLIADRPHRYYSKFDFLSALISNALLGDGYARIHFDTSGAPYALEVLPRDIVSIELTQSGAMLYHVWGNPAPATVFGGLQIVATLQDYEVIHIKGVSFNGIKGERLTLTHKDGLGAALSAQAYTKQFFENGAAVAGAIIFPQSLTKEQRDRVQDKFARDHSGSDNAGKVMVLDSGVKYEKISMGPQEAALVDFRNLSVEDCSRIFKIPLHMLSSLDRSTYSNIEQQENDFYAHCLPTWTQKIEQEFNFKLFTRLEREKRRAFVQFDYTFVRMGDSQSTAQLIASTIQNGIMTQNEWRQRLNLPTMADGNERYIQQNMAPVGMLSELLEGKIEQAEGVDVEEPDVEEPDTEDQPAASPQMTDND